MPDQPRILLVGPFDRGAPRPGQYQAPPLGVHRLAGYLRETAGMDVTVCDPALTGRRGFVRALREGHPALVGFSTLAPTLENDLRLVALTRRLLPHAALVVGGQGVAGLEPLLAEQGGADIVVRGFGEEPLLALARLLGHRGRRALLSDSRLADVRNLTISQPGAKSWQTTASLATAELFRAANGALDFARIPYPAYWAVNRRRYPARHVELMRNEGLLNTIRLITQSHCPLGCNYCSSTRFLDVVEGRRQMVLMQESGEIVATMDRALAAHPTATSFYLNDDDFVLRRSRALEFARLVKERYGARRLSFICMTRVDHVDDELAQALAAAGFRLVFLGVETFSAGTLLAMDKHLRHAGDYTSAARGAVLTLLRAGIVPQVGLIPFYPAVRAGELLVTVENAIDLVARGARLSIFPLTDAYPGASLFGKGSHSVSYKAVQVGSEEIRLPLHFLPDDPAMRDLATRAVAEHEAFRGAAPGSALPQPADGLHFLRTVLRLLSRDTSTVDRLLADLETAGEQPPGSPLHYVNA
jgi:radical SAM superfamily enzyme YgiQ (UPF0313 family)